MVNGKQDERVGIRGPILDEFLDSDPQISILKDNIYKLLHTNMIHVKTYGHRFNYVSEYLTKNALIAHESIKKETGNKLIIILFLIDHQCMQIFFYPLFLFGSVDYGKLCQNY